MMTPAQYHEDPRRPRFRAWDIERGHFSSNVMLSLDGTLCWQFGYNATASLSSEESQQFILERWTGKCDRNGLRIFEGDILATWNTDPKYDLWASKECGYTVVRWTPDAGFHGSTWTWNEDPASVYAMQFVSVIGNIHEDQKLLDEEAHERGERQDQQRYRNQ